MVSRSATATTFERQNYAMFASVQGMVSTMNSKKKERNILDGGLVSMATTGKHSGDRLLATAYNDKWNLKKSKPSHDSIFGPDSLKPLKRSVSQPCSEASTRPGSSSEGSSCWESEGNSSCRGSTRSTSRPFGMAPRRNYSRATSVGMPGQLGKVNAEEGSKRESVLAKTSTATTSHMSPSVLTAMKLQKMNRRSSISRQKALLVDSPRSNYDEQQEEIELPKSKAPVCLAHLAHKWRMDLHTVQEASDYFRKQAKLPGLPGKEDIHVDGVLSQKAMIKVACEICQVGSVSEMTRDAKEIMIMVDANGDGVVSFEEFAIWYTNRAFVSCVSVDRKQLEVRDLGHKLGMTVVEMETYQELYRKFDTDGSGDVDYDEFSELLEKCMRVPAGSHLPDTRVKKLWHECDIDGSGGIDLEEFVIFYRNHFNTGAADSGTVDNYYSNIRRSSFSIPKPGQ